MTSAPRPNISVTIDRDDLARILELAKESMPYCGDSNFNAECHTCIAFANVEEAIA